MKVASRPFEQASASGPAELFREHYPWMKRLARSMTTDDQLAEELAADAFVRSWKKLDDLASEPAAAKAYLRKTLVNLCRRSFRRRVHEMRTRVLHAVPDPEPDPDAHLVVASAVRRLPPRQRACVALRYLEELTEKETADALGVSVGTVKSQTHKALKRLEEILGEDHGA